MHPSIAKRPTMLLFVALCLLCNVRTITSSADDTPGNQWRTLKQPREMQMRTTLRRSLAQSAPAPIPSTTELCSDHPPPGNYTCDQQKSFGKCEADFIKSRDFCRRTCNRCDDICNDVAPPGQYSCADQKSFGKCNEPYVRDWGYCALTCNRCSVESFGAQPNTDVNSSSTGAKGNGKGDSVSLPGKSGSKATAPHASSSSAPPYADDTGSDASPNGDTGVDSVLPGGNVGNASSVRDHGDLSSPGSEEGENDQRDRSPQPQSPAMVSSHMSPDASADDQTTDESDAQTQAAQHEALLKAAAERKAAAAKKAAAEREAAKKRAAAALAAAKAKQAAAKATQAVRVPEAAATHVVHSHGDTDDASALPEDAATTTVVHHHHSVYAYVHGGLMVMAFGVILPIGIFTSRYAKWWATWFNMHRAMQIVGYVVATAGFFLGLSMHKLQDFIEQRHAHGRRLLHDHAAVIHDAAWQRRHKIFLSHKYVGIAIFVGLSLQVLAALLKRPEKGSKLRSVWEYAHWGVGWMSLAAGLANDASGLVLLQPLSAWYTVGFAALVVAIAGWLLYAEVRRCVYGHELEGYTQAGEHGGLEMVGGNSEEREVLTRAGHPNGHAMYDGIEDDDEELAMVTAKYARS
mmetsp:Transcript_13803/g.41704  ORF Transcript_13803/g.41704 Transcript_13803/m.41704 type:complete len:632 (-) Transcript_13803:368-2263(-)|eukprot:CAMPEP_0206139004 /NCGR_PEP_ID=MMETSP1473-20131121/4339_1 /ASSEMBLY_ACC=CAM_ASM_001109 /TAXON_ID=1461547 /ORGANISM="Stichococcus sp, Strain RCC1054" /LENGTH=631 /DNA_ID=CAMNT_0053532607 /DNA_START=59 /DNA_END=1954 /DNA_ORIENTATION=+